MDSIPSRNGSQYAYTGAIGDSETEATGVAETFGQWLGRQLRRHQMNQVELARRSGLSQGRISDWLHDKRLPSTKSCDKLADALGEDLDYVLALAGHRPGAPKDEDPEVSGMIALIRKIRWNDERRIYIKGLLEDMRSLDRAAAGG
jgi:transcriptional regulator with XRE-family HTH domain